MLDESANKSNGSQEPENQAPVGTKPEAGKNSPRVPLEKSGSAVLGDIVWLMTQSPQHKHLFLSDLEWLVLPPVSLKQFKVFYANRRPVAVAFWACVSEDTDKELKLGRRLKPTEWNTGERVWLIELIAPGLASQALDRLLAELSKSVFGKPFAFNRWNSKTGHRDVAGLHLNDQN